ncbi:histidine phosphatase family protein [Geodermatophilus sp. DSM 45219]|uniref:histidine phosphatase family protein n=1 Tax=Geodermatophilus sp. DSM 45219 TaxID=1881103 RepID=UPI000880FC11|nr:histidine phosphatase family protein [Geodermatophilus sp. DSM 45219]SDO17784.1 probable phosphoglycerate mutase [Geodermatophilus sp. DSM 45219]
MSDLPALPVPRLLLWRHGRTEWNAEGRFQGQLDPPLDEVGRRQARVAAPHLAAPLPEGTVVVSSDLVRAAETAVALTDVLGVPLRLDPRLREVGMGSWEGLTRQEVAERHPDQYADWLAGRPISGRGGEESADVPVRALAAVAELPEAPAAVVVTHGGTSARVIEALLGLGPEHRRVFGPLANCAWSELAEQSGRWRLLRHNTSAPELPDGPAPSARRPDAGANPEEGAPAPAQDADAL